MSTEFQEVVLPMFIHEIECRGNGRITTLTLSLGNDGDIRLLAGERDTSVLVFSTLCGLTRLGTVSDTHSALRWVRNDLAVCGLHDEALGEDAVEEWIEDWRKRGFLSDAEAAWLRERLEDDEYARSYYE